MPLKADSCPLATPLLLTGFDARERLLNIVGSAPAAVRAAIIDAAVASRDRSRELG